MMQMARTHESKTKASAAVWFSGKRGWCFAEASELLRICDVLLAQQQQAYVWGGATHGVQMFNCPLEAPASGRGYALSRWGGCTGQTVSQAEDLIVLWPFLAADPCWTHTGNPSSRTGRRIQYSIWSLIVGLVLRVFEGRESFSNRFSFNLWNAPVGHPLKMSCLLYPSLPSQCVGPAHGAGSVQIASYCRGQGTMVPFHGTSGPLAKDRCSVVNCDFAKKTNAALEHSVCSLCST